ncbi:MAG: DUF3570 domain-containing protein [Planctomycetota bacterium]|nr:DUF3570 domain-containing protein [Planctomycetota bacterium]
MLLGRPWLALLCVAQLASLAPGQESAGPAKPGVAASDKLGATSHGDAGDQSWTVRLGLFDRDDSGGSAGNPFLDESLTIIEPAVIYDNQVSDDFGYDIKFSYDFVSSASIERLSNFSGQSGASRDNYLSLDFGFRHKLSNTDSLSWHLDLATEYDYTSFGLGGGWSHEFVERDASLSLNLNLYEDTIKPIRFDGSEDADESRTSLAGTLGWYQVLGPRTHGEFGLTFSDQSGFLETAYNAVVQEDPSYAANPNLANNAQGIEFTEELPDSRTRTALFGRVRHGLSATDAIELGARLYDDDWGIAAWDLTPRWLHEFESGLLMDLRYRYYTQDAADYWSESFTGTGAMPTFRTQDSDLGKFNSSLLGSHWTWGRQKQWDLGVNYLSRSDGLDHIYLSLGWTTSY